MAGRTATARNDVCAALLAVSTSPPADAGHERARREAHACHRQEQESDQRQKDNLPEATLVIALLLVLRSRSSELSQVREQGWSLLRRHEPAINHKAVRGQNRRQVGWRVEPSRAPEERIVMVEHGLERRR